MSVLRRVTAEGPAYVPSTPSRIYDDPAGQAVERIGHETGRVGAALGGLGPAFQRIADQQAESDADTAFNKWREGEAAIRTGLFQADPNDPEARIPRLADVESFYATQMQELKDSLSEPLSGQARYLFNKVVDQHGATQRIKVRGDILATAALQEKAQIIALGDEDARRAASALPNERGNIIANHIERLGRAEQRGILSATDYTTLRERFEQGTLRASANILSRTPEGRAKLYEQVAAGDFDRLNEDTLSRIVQRAQAADQRTEKIDRENERAIKAAQNDRETELGELINQRKTVEATTRLEFFENLRLLPADDITKWRKAILAPPGDKLSDPTVAGRILLDVESINPTVTEAEIDGAYRAHAAGLPGLSLKDAVSAKNQLRATRLAMQNRAEDKELDRRMKEHTQAEQELRAMLGIRPDFVQAKLADDPAGRMYSVLLPELRRDSYAYPGGTKKPLEIVEKMRPRINEGLGPQSQMSQKEINALYPTVQSLEDAWNRRIISEEAMNQALQSHRYLVPRLPVSTPVKPAPSAGRKSQSYGSQ